ncbi:hypothetical protein Q31b_22610 [Novipirellula aureliae]|uniref:Uncharacterized protein n=1 Tax=Novipirellula aureliae TaxID=2527966 RepID=A0A5C6E0K4_9BACT|nr:hypothetical protein [Novipirellula aureliae]TWU43223.1 hypothetical protein Q31b_22610 [Novipirellula aureliae]
MSRLFTLSLLVFASTACYHTAADAHQPSGLSHPVYPRIDVIGPVGNRLPESYRRRYNRPTYVGGKIANLIAPSSQEAITWEHADQRCDYDHHHGRIVPQYFYPKPWEALRVGARTPIEQTDADESMEVDELIEIEPMEEESFIAPLIESTSPDEMELNPSSFREYLQIR